LSGSIVFVHSARQARYVDRGELQLSVQRTGSDETSELSRLPSVASYLAMLPRGLDSYASCVAKRGGMFGLTGAPHFDELSAMLPPELKQLYDTTLPSSSWVSEVQHHALVLAMRDVCFASECEFLDFFFELNREFLARDPFNLIFASLTIDRLVRGASERWAVFHRGSVLRSVELGASTIRFSITAPPYVFTPLVSRHYIGAFQAGFAAALHVDAPITVESCSPTVTLYRVQMK
jgi:hypothetical protein